MELGMQWGKQIRKIPIGDLLEILKTPNPKSIVPLLKFIDDLVWGRGRRFRKPFFLLFEEEEMQGLRNLFSCLLGPLPKEKDHFLVDILNLIFIDNLVYKTVRPLGCKDYGIHFEMAMIKYKRKLHPVSDYGRSFCPAIKINPLVRRAETSFRRHYPDLIE